LRKYQAMDELVTSALLEAATQKAETQTEGEPGDDEKKAKVTDQLRKDWNLFLDYAESKGLRGKPDLDKGGKGYQLYDEFIQANKGKTSLTRDALPAIRQEMLEYRKWALANIKKGKGVIKKNDGTEAKPEEYDDIFMKQLVENEKTADPNYPGQYLTSLKFPGEYMNQPLNMGKSLVGFASTASKAGGAY
jgi:hypothetical protein